MVQDTSSKFPACGRQVIKLKVQSSQLEILTLIRI